jgi:hypothetical protein
MNRRQKKRSLPHADPSSRHDVMTTGLNLVTLFTVKDFRTLFLPFIDFIAFPGEMFALSVVCFALCSPVTLLYIYQTRAIHQAQQEELCRMYHWLTYLLHDPLHLRGTMFHRQPHDQWSQDEAVMFHVRLQCIARVLIYYFPGLVDPNATAWSFMIMENPTFPLARTDIPDRFRHDRSFYLRTLGYLFSRHFRPSAAEIWYEHALFHQRLELELALRVNFGIYRREAMDVEELWANSARLGSHVPSVDGRPPMSVDFVDDVDGDGMSLTHYLRSDVLVRRYAWQCIGRSQFMTRLHVGFEYPF